MGLDNLFPALDTVSFTLREHDPTIDLIDFFDENIDFVTSVDFSTLEMADRDFAFGLVTNVYDDPIAADTDHPTGDDLVFLEIDYRIAKDLIDPLHRFSLEIFAYLFLQRFTPEVKLLE